MRKHLKIERII